MQSAANPQYSGIVDCVRKTLATEGVRHDAGCTSSVDIPSINFTFSHPSFQSQISTNYEGIVLQSWFYIFNQQFSIECMLMVLNVAKRFF